MQQTQVTHRDWGGPANDIPQYGIGTVSEIIGEHPETLRTWERHGLIRPNRSGYHRKFSNTDILRLRFIKHLIGDKGLNLTGVYQTIGGYSCWHIRSCRGDAVKNSRILTNGAKPCWKQADTYCLTIADFSELCQNCELFGTCSRCTGCMG